jgi:hypothetical protein
MQRLLFSNRDFSRIFGADVVLFWVCLAALHACPHFVCGDRMEHMENESPEVKKQHEEGHHSSEVRTAQLK